MKKAIPKEQAEFLSRLGSIIDELDDQIMKHYEQMVSAINEGTGEKSIPLAEDVKLLRIERKTVMRIKMVAERVLK